MLTAIGTALRADIRVFPDFLIEKRNSGQASGCCAIATKWFIFKIQFVVFIEILYF
jgi:hypothetical protein